MCKDTVKQVATVGGFFERVGILVHRRLISQEIVFQLMSWAIVQCWDHGEPVLLELRHTRVPTFYLYFEKLAERARQCQNEDLEKAKKQLLEDFPEHRPHA